MYWIGRALYLSKECTIHFPTWCTSLKKHILQTSKPRATWCTQWVDQAWLLQDFKIIERWKYDEVQSKEAVCSAVDIGTVIASVSTRPLSKLSLNVYIWMSTTFCPNEWLLLKTLRTQGNKFHLASASHVGQAKPNGHIVPKQLPRRNTQKHSPKQYSIWKNKQKIGLSIHCCYLMVK